MKNKKSKKLISFFPFFLSIISCREKIANLKPEKFNLTGKTNNLPDGTVLYFVDALSNQVFDSVEFFHGKYGAPTKLQF